MTDHAPRPDSHAHDSGRPRRAHLLVYAVAMAFPLAILVSNPTDAPPFRDIGLTLGLVLLVAALFDVASRLVIRTSPAREIIVALGLIALGAYGYVDLQLLGQAVPQQYLLVIWSAVFLALMGLAWLAADRAWLRRLASILQSWAVALVLIQLAYLAASLAPELWNRGRVEARLGPTARLPAGSTPNERPDIYYIVLDGYGRQDVLRAIYGYDNTQFIDQLKARGFFVAPRSRSNYHQTTLSLASSLNMTYLDGLGLEGFKSRLPLFRMLNDNRVVRSLAQLGYSSVAFSTGYSLTECTQFDRYIIGGTSLTDFQNALFSTTPLHPLLRWSTSTFDAHRQRILRTFAMLPDVAREAPSPSFVFVHLIAPHPPFVFDRRGNPIDPKGAFAIADGGAFMAHWKASRDDYLRGYRGQLEFVNQRLLETVDGILANSSRRSIIILQGDHGPGATFTSNAKTTDLWERLSILNAVYQPPGTAAKLPEDLSPVNTFRIILDHYFGTNLGVLDNRCFFSPWDKPYDFEDVTGMIVEAPAGRRVIQASSH